MADLLSLIGFFFPFALVVLFFLLLLVVILPLYSGPAFYFSFDFSEVSTKCLKCLARSLHFGLAAIQCLPTLPNLWGVSQVLDTQKQLPARPHSAWSCISTAYLWAKDWQGTMILVCPSFCTSVFCLFLCLAYTGCSVVWILSLPLVFTKTPIRSKSCWHSSPWGSSFSAKCAGPSHNALLRPSFSLTQLNPVPQVQAHYFPPCTSFYTTVRLGKKISE